MSEPSPAELSTPGNPSLSKFESTKHSPSNYDPIPLDVLTSTALIFPSSAHLATESRLATQSAPSDVEELSATGQSHVPYRRRVSGKGTVDKTEGVHGFTRKESSGPSIRSVTPSGADAGERADPFRRTISGARPVSRQSDLSTPRPSPLDLTFPSKRRGSLPMASPTFTMTRRGSLPLLDSSSLPTEVRQPSFSGTSSQHLLALDGLVSLLPSPDISTAMTDTSAFEVRRRPPRLDLVPTGVSSPANSSFRSQPYDPSPILHQRPPFEERSNPTSPTSTTSYRFPTSLSSRRLTKDLIS